MPLNPALLQCALAGFALLTNAHPLLDSNLVYRSPFVGHGQVSRTGLSLTRCSLLTSLELSWTMILEHCTRSTNCQLDRLLRLHLSSMNHIRPSTAQISAMLVHQLLFSTFLNSFLLEAPLVWNGGITFSHNVASVSSSSGGYGGY